MHLLEARIEAQIGASMEGKKIKTAKYRNCHDREAVTRNEDGANVWKKTMKIF